MATNGAIGFIHRFGSVAEQAENVKKSQTPRRIFNDDRPHDWPGPAVERFSRTAVSKRYIRFCGG